MADMHLLPSIALLIAICAAAAALGFVLGGKRRAVRFLAPVLGFMLVVGACWGVALLLPRQTYQDHDAAFRAANNAARLAIYCGIGGGILGLFAGDFIAGKLFGPANRRGGG